MRSLRSILGDSTAAKPILAVIVVLLLITSTVGAYVVLIAGSPDKGVEAGDVVKVHYTGTFADGRVFDTSLWEVANDSDSEKSLFFSLRGNETKYVPLEFKVGGYTMITGFDQGVRGMKVGETKQFNVSVAQGYGPMDTKLMKTMHLVETLPLNTEMNKATFKATFGQDPASMMEVYHSRLGIEAYVLSYDQVSDKAMVSYGRNAVGDTFGAYDYKSAYGWTVEVTNITSSSITVKHQLTVEDDFRVRGYDNVGVVDSRTKRLINDFYVDSVDEETGTFVMNYNPEITGRVLTFTVTLVSVA